MVNLSSCKEREVFMVRHDKEKLMVAQISLCPKPRGRKGRGGGSSLTCAF